jgi:hypothetical protein
MKLKKTKSKDVKIEMVGMPEDHFKPPQAPERQRKASKSPAPQIRNNPEVTVVEPAATRDKGLKGVAFTVDFDDVKPLPKKELPSRKMKGVAFTVDLNDTRDISEI